MKKQNLVTFLLALAASGSLSAKEPAAIIEPAAKALLEESITALGGREAMAKIKTRQIEGEMLMPAQGMKMKLTMIQEAPAKTYTKMVIPEMMTVEQGYDGKTAWSKDNIQGSRELKGPELDQAKESAAMFPELVIMENLLSAKVLADVEGNDTTLKVIKVTSKDAPAKTLYFNETSKLLTKMTSNFITGPEGSMEVTIAMSDYKEKDGIKFATKMSMTLMGQEVQMTYGEVKNNIEVDASLFTMPK
jgi:hypothetical protein